MSASLDLPAEVLDLVEQLAMSLTILEHGGAGGRRAITDAIDQIDSITRHMHALRFALIAEARRFDDAAMKRSAELLERLKRMKGEQP